MVDGMSIPRGDNFFSQSNFGGNLYIDPISGSETTARIYIRNSANWNNLNINQGGNPEDVIIYVAGSLSINGNGTTINAIIYVAGVINQNGGQINGAVTAGAGIANVNYDADAINNADFNDLCENNTALSYPYYTDFEDSNTEWDFTGEWAISNNASGDRVANSPTQFLDNNPNEIDQSYYRNYYATLNQALLIPNDAVNPTLRFAYKAQLTSGDIYIQASTDGSTWQQIRRITEEYRHDTYTYHEINLDAFKGENLQIRFRQYMHAASGPRLFIIDDLSIADLDLPDLGYPYTNTFETADERSHFDDEADWGINTAHDDYYPADGSYFLDNNTLNVDQRYHRTQYVTQAGYITLPSDASNVVASFDYRAELNTSDYVFFQVQEYGSNSWVNLNTFDSQENHPNYTNYEYALTNYANKKVRFRFRQYHGATNGARIFSIDNFYIGEQPVTYYDFPYFNDFEEAVSIPNTNGRDHWNVEGDWGLNKAHDSIYVPYEGEYFLDNNSDNEDQRYHRNHYARLNGYIPIPSDASAPVVSFWHNPTVFSGFVDLQIQVEGSNSWQHLFRFTDQLSHEDYVKQEVSLDNYRGNNVRFRFRQYWHSENGSRVFSVDNFYVGENDLPVLTFPYFNDFETPESTAEINGQDQWNDAADWGVSTTHDIDYIPYSGSYFLDNNANFVDQRYHRNHYTDLLGYIPIPSDSEAPTLSFYYKANIFSGQTYLQVQEQGSNTWRTLTTFTDQLNHSTYARHEYSLSSYKGKNVRFRFRQYWNSTTGERLFTIDDFKVAELALDTYEYPYLNDFETAVSTDEINGQDHWNHQGDWNISTAHDTEYYPRSGAYFLDNNADNEDQRYHRNHYVEMNGFVPIPADAESPELSFWYRANIYSGQTYVQLQVEGTNTWTNLQTFSEQFTHTTYARYAYSLDNYKGSSVRIRYRQYWNADSGGRVFTVDDFRIGDNDQTSLGYPYLNDLESSAKRQEFIHEHDWGISQEHDVDYVPYEGDWFIDNNADFEDQRYHRNHYVTLSGYVPIPSNATLPTLSFWYKANIFSGQTYAQIKRRNESVWRNLYTFSEQFSHSNYTRADLNLDNYKGDEVFIRFRQYWNNESGPRLFTVDNVRIGNFENVTYNYPYFNDFETDQSTTSISGRDDWNDEGDWGLSNEDDVSGSSFSGKWYLNSNPDDEDQRYHRNHYTTMRGFVPIPASANNPEVSFYYTADISSGYVELQIQREGEWSWRRLERFEAAENTTTYTKFVDDLSQYKGENVRFRFRQYFHSGSGARYFSIDDFFVGQDVLSLWYFEENWLDSSGQGITLSPVNNPTFSNSNRAKDGPAVSETSTCFYTEYDGSNYSRATNTASVSQIPELTVSLWAKANAFTSGLQALFTKGSGFGIYLNATGHVEWHYGDQILTSTTPLVVNEWRHITVTFSSGDQKLYFDGGLNTSASHNVTLSNIDQDIFLATEFDGSTVNIARNFNGDLDEVRFYFSAQDSDAINQDINNLHPCDIQAQPHHFLIEHSSTGLTCAAETATIKACLDESCTELSDQSVTLDLTGNSVVKATTTFTGSTTVNFNHTSVETLTLGIANESTPATDATACFNGIDDSCNIAFESAGFRFLYGTNNTDIDAQIAGQTFTEDVKVQAVKDNNGVCEGLFSGNVAIKLSKQLSSSSSSGLAFEAAGQDVPTLPTYSSDITINFGADSIGVIPSVVYYDADQVRLYASYSDTDISLSGSSNAFWVRPASFVLTAGNTAGTNNLDQNAGGALAHYKAGDLFYFNVTAVNTNGDTTLNYQPQNTVNMSVTRNAPISIDASEGLFTYASSSTISSSDSQQVSLTTFSNGSSSFSAASYSEVGEITIDVEDTNYGQNLLGDPLTVSSQAPLSLVRFTPAYYTQSVVDHGSIVNNFNDTVISTCNSEQSFAYIGQRDAVDNNKGSLRYNLLLPNKPVIKISAFNANNELTLNYLDSQVTLSDTSVDILPPTNDRLVQGTDNNLLPMAGATFSGLIESFGVTGVEKGSVHYTLSDEDNFYYQRTSESQVSAFEPNFDLVVNSIVDADGISLADPALIANPTEDIMLTGVAEMRFGRLVVDNSFGPEISDIRQTLQTQYLRDGQFIINSQDNCSPIRLANMSLASTGSLSPSDTRVIGNDGSMIVGANDTLLLEAVSEGNTGEIQVNYDAPSWLEYDWSASGTLDEDPIGIATFGRFRGNDRVIHWREKGN